MAKILTREELFELAWNRPLSQLGPELGISDVALKKLCRRHKIPTPSRGWWAQKAAGQHLAPPTLPEGREVRITFHRVDTPASPFGAIIEDAREKALATLFISKSQVARKIPEIDATIAALKDAKPDMRGMLQSTAPGVFRCSVFPNSLQRSKSILTSVISEAFRHGFTISKCHESLCLELDEVKVGISLLEGYTRKKHERTRSESAQVKRWQDNWRFGSTPYPTIPDWDYSSTGKLRLELSPPSYEYRCALTCNVNDTRLRRIEEVADKIGIELVAMVAAEKDRLSKRAEQRQLIEERRHRQEEALRREHILKKRQRALALIVGELEELENLERQIAQLKNEFKGAVRGERLGSLFEFAGQEVTRRRRQLAVERLEERLIQDKIFGDDDDHDFSLPSDNDYRRRIGQDW